MFSMIDAMIKSMQQRSHHKAILGQISTHLLAQHLHSEEFSYLLTVILSKLSSVTWSDLHTHIMVYHVTMHQSLWLRCANCHTCNHWSTPEKTWSEVNHSPDVPDRFNHLPDTPDKFRKNNVFALPYVLSHIWWPCFNFVTILSKNIINYTWAHCVLRIVVV